ncbi:MAG: hypothetical protein RL227_794 [Pseudomonadota bacterium]
MKSFRLPTLASIAVLGCAALTASFDAAAQTPSSSGAALDILKEAYSKHQTKCVMQDVSACDEYLAGVRRAIEAGTAKQQHDIFKFELEAIYLRGRYEVKKGDYTRALEVLKPGYDAMIAHFDKGRHFHVLIDGQHLLQELVMALHGAGHRANADAITRLTRNAVDRLWEQREGTSKDEYSLQLLREAAMRAESLERRLGGNLVTHHHNRHLPEVQMNLSRQDVEPRLLEAYTRAAQWLLRKEDLEMGTILEEPPQIRYATYKNWTAFLLAKQGKKEEAVDDYMAASSAVCDLADRATASKPSIQRAWGKEAVPHCNEAQLGAARLLLSQEDKDKLMAEGMKAWRNGYDAWYKGQLKRLEEGAAMAEVFIEMEERKRLKR